MEKYAPPGALVELELEAKTAKGVVVKGRIDLYEPGPQSLTDWKCQPAGELVTMADGTEKPIETICIFDKVLAWDNNKFIPAKVIAIVDGGIQDVYEIKIASYQTIRVSGNHPVLTDRGWVEAKDLIAKQDRVIQLRDWTGEGDLSAGDARLLGYLVGDGGTAQRYSINFTNSDKAITDDMAELCTAKGWTLTKSTQEYGWRITNQGKKRSATGPMAFIETHGLHWKHSYEKSVPDAIMQARPKAIAHFLAGYFDADGTLTNPDSTIPSRLTFTTTSPYLAHQVSELLRRLGIDNRAPRYKHGDDRPVYHICVWRARAILDFFKLIPFRRPKMVDRSKGWRLTLEQKSPKGGKNLRRIESIAKLGPMQTIGLEVENYHTYVTSGIVTHNTTRWMYLNKLPYGNHGTQLNIYAWLLRENGYPVEKMQVQYIDLSGPSKCKKCKGPLRPQKGGDYECARCGKMYAGDKVHPGVALVPIIPTGHMDIATFINERSFQLQWALDQGIAPEKVDKKGNWICGYCQFTEQCMAEEMRF